MKKKFLVLALMCLLLPSCSSNSDSGYTKVDYLVSDRDRYDNSFGLDLIPEQWSNYGIGDPYLLRFNGEYYLFSSTKDRNEGYKCWKSHDLIHYEYLGLYRYLNADGSTLNQVGQYAPEIYYWNGDFYCYGSPSGKGHYIYKSTTGLPYGDYQAITDNIGFGIDGSVFIDDDESMTFLTGGDGGILSYSMKSMSEIQSDSEEQLFSPMVKWTEGPFMIKHDDTYFLTYAGNHVKSKGYRINYSYSNEGPREGFYFPSNNSLALKTVGDHVGFGHSSTVLGPNLDSYYIAYHNLVDAGGPIRAFNVNRLSFANNRMSIIGPTYKDNLVPLLPDFVDYDLSNMESNDEQSTFSKASHSNTFSVEYNFKNISTDGSTKFVFSYDGETKNYISITNKKINLFLNGSLSISGNLKNDFDFTKLHTIRISVSNGRYCVYFDNMKKIDYSSSFVVNGGKVGYVGLCTIGTTTFSNDAFDSSENKDPKVCESNIFATSYLKESNLTVGSGNYDVEGDSYDGKNRVYSDTTAVKLTNTKDYLLYPINVTNDCLYGLELTYSQESKGSTLSIQIDNNTPKLFTLPSQDFSKNMNIYEDNLKFVKSLVCELEISKGLHTLKLELVNGSISLLMFNLFIDSPFKANYSNDLSTYIDKGATYLSLWKLTNKDGINCHKAKSGANNLIVLGEETITDVEIEVDINIEVCAGSNSMAGVILRCLNPSLYTGYVDQSSQGYFVGFNMGQLLIDKMNYNSSIVGASTGQQYSLNSWHHLKVNVKGNLITVYFDNVLTCTYNDANPYTHGAIGIYSINAESYYKNLSIKGV